MTMMSGQFYLCLLRHFYSSQPACLPYTQLLSITIGASTESFSFSLGHTSYSSLHIHCSQIFGWVLTAVVSSDVLSQFRLTYRGRLLITAASKQGGCFLRHGTRRLCVVKCSSPAYLRRNVARPSPFPAPALSKLTPPALSLSPHCCCRVTRFLDLSVTVHESGLLHHCGGRRGGFRSGAGRGSTAALRSAAAAADGERRRLDSSQPSAAVQRPGGP